MANITMNTTIRTINDIITTGLKNSPESMGMGGQFYKSMWAASHDEFVKKLESLYEEGDRMYTSAYYGTGNAGPIGEVRIYNEKGYVYVFLMNNYGNYQANLFTHSVIAGNYPSYEEYKHCKYEEWRAEIRSGICG